ncbi:MAG: redoxin [Leptothrix sp. (in: Bacteria)]|nr:redoxin [Leptothrix sp. (in: b-proteobacteria)]
MLAISLGPLALPVAPLLLVGAVIAAQQVATWLARRQPVAGPTELAAQPGADQARDAAAARGASAGSAFTVAALLGLVAARAAWLMPHAQVYLDAPLAMLDIRDGGWHAGAGLLAGAAWLGWRALRQPGLRQPLAAGAATGGLLWWAATAAIGTGTGAPLPTMALTDHKTGSAVTLAQAAEGRPAVVVLWAAWCGPCRAEMPLLAAAQQREPGLRFLFVNQGEDQATVRHYLASLPYPVNTVLLDAGSALGPAVGSPGLPTTVFYDARGRRVAAHFGMLNAAALQSRLERLRQH